MYKECDRRVFTSRENLRISDGKQTLEGFQFTEEFYNTNEEFLYSFIHNTKKNKESKLLKEVFGNN